MSDSLVSGEGSGELPEGVSVTRTIAECDVYLFAGITGDLSPVHTNAEYMGRTEIGERIVHGAYVLGLMSAAAAKWCSIWSFDALSYGYNRLRFTYPVKFGDTVTVYFRPRNSLERVGRVVASVEAFNQEGRLVAVADHILQRMDVI